jgi:hypothetical protein
VAQLQKTGEMMQISNEAMGKEIKTAVGTQGSTITNSIKVNMASLESSVTKVVGDLDQKIASDKTVSTVVASQRKTSGEIQALKKQAAEIRKLLETQQNRITFP